MSDVITEDDLLTFDGWLKYQAIDATTTPASELANWREIFDGVRFQAATTPKVGLMKLRALPGEHRYAVAVQDGADLWLALWVRRSPKGEFFILVPRSDRGWEPHTSYHLDGKLHLKSYGKKVFPPQQRQPLAGQFRGTEHLGAFFGYGPKSVGAVCDPAAFAGIVKVAPGVLGPKQGGVTVDLVEPGYKPAPFDWTQIVTQQTFSDVDPCVVITVGMIE
jgi:hypothetical protein